MPLCDILSSDGYKFFGRLNSEPRIAAEAIGFGDCRKGVDFLNWNRLAG